MAGGTLVSDKYVVTAAHVVHAHKTKFYDDLYASVGETNTHNALDAEHFISKINSIIEHPDYVPSKKIYEPFFKYVPSENDIAIIELEKVVDLRSYPHIKPACLPYRSQISDFVGQTAVVTGWGYEKFKGSHTKNVIFFSGQSTKRWGGKRFSTKEKQTF